MPPFRTLPQAQPDQFAGQNVKAFADILQAIGKAETLRKDRYLRTRVMKALSMDAGPEEIASIVGQQVPYSAGVPGIFQRIGGMFGPKTTPIESDITSGMIENMFSKGRLGTIPGWWAFATEKQKQDYMDRVGGPVVQIGQRLLTEDQRQQIAEKDYQEKMGLSSSDKDLARKSCKTIINQISPSRMKYIPGARNFRQEQLIDAYKQYQTENDYSSKSAENRKFLDDVWDGQIETYNKAGLKGHGKNELQWDPKDQRVAELRKVQTKEGRLSQPPPPMRNKVTNWRAFPENIKKQIWQAYENGWHPDEIMKSLKAEK